MKYSEMNAHERVAAGIAWEKCGDIVGGYENQMQDNLPGSEDYEEAKNALANHEHLVDMIYDEVMFDADKGSRKHLRFAGKEFILARIDRRLKKWGY